MKQLSEAGWDVYFVENTGFRNPSWRDLSRLIAGLKHRWNRKSQGNGVRNPVPTGVHLLAPWVLPPNGRVFRWLNRQFFVPHMVRRLRALGLTQADMGFVYLPSATTLQLLAQVRPRHVVYDCVAHFAAHPECPSDFLEIEKRLLEQSDLVITDSTFLFDHMKEKHAHVVQLHQGVDVQLFLSDLSSDAAPSAYRSVCFFGGIDDRIDWDVLQLLADAGAHVTLIGVPKVPVPDGIEVRGPFGYEQLANEIQNYDVFLLPYHMTKFTDGIIPAKIYECMATGKPILTAALPSLQCYDDVLYACRTPQDYVRHFQGLCKTETEEKRRKRQQIACGQTVEQTGRRLQQLLSEVRVAT